MARTVASTLVVASSLAGFALFSPARVHAATPNTCAFSKQSDDAVAAANKATDQGDYLAALGYQIQAQMLDEQSAGSARGTQAQATCYSTILSNGTGLVQNEVLYGTSQQAWQYARHLAAIWQSYQGYKLSPAQQGNYTTFFVDITQALRACYPDCPVSDEDAAQTKANLLQGL